MTLTTTSKRCANTTNLLDGYLTEPECLVITGLSQGFDPLQVHFRKSPGNRAFTFCFGLKL